MVHFSCQEREKKEKTQTIDRRLQSNHDMFTCNNNNNNKNTNNNNNNNNHARPRRFGWVWQTMPHPWCLSLATMLNLSLVGCGRPAPGSSNPCQTQANNK